MQRVNGHAQLISQKEQLSMQRDVLEESKRTEIIRNVNQRQDADVVARQVMWRMIVITKQESA